MNWLIRIANGPWWLKAIGVLLSLSITAACFTLIIVFHLQS